MSYCRFLNADAYIFQSISGLECCGCSIAPRTKLKTPYTDMFGFEHEYDFDRVVFEKPVDMLDHIAIHRMLGHNIPESVDERIRADFPDLMASTAETEEERLEREERMRPVNERMKAKMRQAYFESFSE